MQRISRLYVSHFGSPTAWYDHLLFDLSDPETALPTDVIFNLENGGGKTSLLSYVFSCFDPSQERWLQHLQKKSLRFGEYFSRDGALSLIVQEWLMPARSTTACDYKLIIGQAVVFKESKERGSDVDRHFFAFEGNSKLQLESIPAPGLSPNELARNMPEFMQWIQHASHHAGDFFSTKVQNDWIKHLGNNRLLDIELLRMQVDFNSNEGGMEEGFLTFNSEADLVRRLLILTLDAEKSNAVRDAVAQTADKLKAKPRHERRLAQLTRLQTVMQPFADAALVYETADLALQKTQGHAAGVAAAILLREQQCQAKAIERNDFARLQNDIADNAKRTAVLLQGEMQSMQGLQYERSVALTKAKLDTVQQALQDAKLKLRHIRAAKALAYQQSCHNALQDLEAMYQSALEELHPFREHAEIQGALLNFGLLQAEQTAIAQRLEAQNTERDANEAIEGIDQQKQTLTNAITQNSQEIGGLNKFDRICQQQQEKLIAAQLLQAEDILAKDALQRLQFELEENELKQNAIQEQTIAAEQTEQTMLEAARNTGLQASTAHAEQEPIEKFLAAGNALREELSQLEVLCIASDASEADPDLANLLLSLEALQTDAQKELVVCGIHLKQWQESRSAIIETGLAGNNSDVGLVLRQLQEAGIRSAQAGNEYVANLMPEVTEARQLVISDPAKFLGISVASGEWDKLAQIIPKLKHKPAQPLTIAISSLIESAADHQRLVIAPESDAAYNKPAAAIMLASLDSRISSEKEKQRAYDERVKECGAAQEKLKRYQVEYGSSRLRLAEAELEQCKAKEQNALHQQQHFQIKAEEARRAYKALGEQLKSLTLSSMELKNSILRLEEYQRDYETPRIPNRERLAQLEQVLAEQQHTLTTLEQRRKEFELARQNAIDAKKDYGNSITALQQERAAIKFLDIDFPAQEQIMHDPHGLESLRFSYAQASAILETEESRRLGVLATKLENARKNLEHAKKEFNDAFPDVPHELLQAYIRLDFRIEIPRQEMQLDEAQNCNHIAGEAYALAKHDQKVFWSGKKQIPTTPHLLQLSDEQLQAEIHITEEKISSQEHIIEQAATQADRALDDANVAHMLVKQLQFSNSNLQAAIPSLLTYAAEAIALPNDDSNIVSELISTYQQQFAYKGEAVNKARDAFTKLTNMAQSADLKEVDPDLAASLTASEFDAACLSRQDMIARVVDRISAVRDTLASMEPDFENCVGELFGLAHDGISLLNHACAKTMPINAPYVGGKRILKIKANLAGISVDAKKEAIRHYLNTLIHDNVIPAKGADLVVSCLLAISGRTELGLQVLKMEQNEAWQYQLAADLKSSRGQGTVIAMFLYLLISQLRADTQARAKRGGGGPLILDNPFAKVQTRALIDAQRLLAKEIGVQLIFFTANADHNILAGFKRVIRLRKSGANNKTNRSHIEMASATFADLTQAEIVGE